ncbi:hypothetical protein sscle_03g026460 [Sclerotinia sclerotiorum 1980 UF-70]|uniref:Mutanase n=1 Tax=Sclerotinia sclerotiorum (strain ATCC 18683 / 1980 / Ss-1) TaxID=665079 RepID=A0A1D9PYZ5_SCLS1|nr:hypothetical protein sscle_03g026460 [Sclerotinia sclerotiorum 1980 UF-70]
MKWLHIFTVLLVLYQVQAAAVLAHFMVGKTQYFTQSDWETNMQTAIDYYIDAFALNMAYGWIDNVGQVSLAFAAADSVDFKLFYSFDYAGNGPWPKADPFVSTFEGPDSSSDWVDIRAQTRCFFVPDWSSIGAGPELAKGVADGLFTAWRWGDWRMNTYSDAAYNTSPAGLPYMMPVSPWFYTNLPGYDKNWLWSSDDLWFDCWQEVWSFQPEWVEIITWNDFGESHYIGPLYVSGMPHDAWGLSLPYLIDTFKNGVGTITQENLYVWHRLSPATACENDFTKGNTASQLQIEFLPWDIVTDRIFFSALLVSGASYTVTIGVTSYCSRTAGYTNWNAFTAYEAGDKTGGESMLNLSDQKCIEGFGTNDFNTICAFCINSNKLKVIVLQRRALAPRLERLQKLPDVTGFTGYPANGIIEYQGLWLLRLCKQHCLRGLSNCAVYPDSLAIQPPSMHRR